MATFFHGFDKGTFPGLAIMEQLAKNTCLKWCGYYLDNESKDDAKLKNPKLKWSSASIGALYSMGWGIAPIYLGKSTRSHQTTKRGEPQLNLGFQRVREDVEGLLYKDAKILAAARSAARRNHHFVESPTKEGQRFVDWTVQLLMNFEGYADGNEAVRFARTCGILPPTVIYFDMENHPSPNEFFFPEWIDYYRGWARALTTAHYGYGLYGFKELAAVVIERFKQMSIFSVQVSPFVWIAQYPDPPQAYSATKSGIFKGSQKTSGPLVQGDLTKFNNLAQSWQHIGGQQQKGPDGKFREVDATLTWQVGNHWASPITVDLNSSIFPDPGRPYII